MARSAHVSTAAVALATVSLMVGCDGKTIDANRTQSVSPDGKTATQTQVRTRETASGTVVKETATRTREVVSPATQTNTPPDARVRDPGNP